MKSQEHLLKFRDELTLQQLDNLRKDLSDASTLISNTIPTENTDLIASIDFTKSSIQDSNTRMNTYYQMEQASMDAYELEGLKAISDGHVALIALAGGLSTRLSISYPKGTYSVDLLSSKSLFQLQAERIIRIKHLANQK